MKKILAFWLMLCLLLPAFSLLVLAEEPSMAETDVSSTYEALRPFSISYTCTYDTDSASVKLGGTVNHDTMITYRNATLEVYGVLPGETLDRTLAREDAEPLAVAPISVRFSFSLPIQYFSERFSRYALVLRSSDGEIFFTEEPKYATVTSQKPTSVDRNLAFQGIESDQSVLAASLGVGTVIIPVELDRLLSSVSHGYLYAVDQSYRYFDKAYVDELDGKIRTFSATGTRVYLQILLSPTSELADLGEESVADYALPDVYADDVYPVIGACAEFLADRYAQNGMKVSGWIVGSSIDQKCRNDWGTRNETEYVDAYVSYLSMLAAAGRGKDSSLTVVLPFSSLNVYAVESVSVPAADYNPAELLESILARLNEQYSETFQVSAMIESSDLPLGLTNANLEEWREGEITSEKDRLTPENADAYSAYLATLRTRYANAPESFLYVWTPPRALTGNALSCAYAYSYYRLLLNKRVSSFVLSVGEDSASALSSLERLLRRIDTADSFLETKNLLPYFGASQWSEVINAVGDATVAARTLYRYDPESFEDRSFEGSFSYFSFADGNVSAWSRGAGASGIHSDYSELGLRGLRTKISKDLRGEFAEILVDYEYPENLVYTPYLSLDLSVTDSGEEANHLYEVWVTLGDATSTLLAKTVLRPRELGTVRIDLSEWIEDGHMAEYLKISVRPLTEQTGDYSFWLFGVDGYSTEYSSEKLRELIEAERLRIRNETATEEESRRENGTNWIVFGVLIGITALGLIVLIFFRREENEEADSSDNHR